MISIIIPIYNAEKYLDQCIESCLEQTFSDIEIILVNDGSKDESLKICKKYAEIDSRIKVITIVNQGVSCARNEGLKNASGDYITFVDADDWIENNYIFKLYHAIKTTKTDLVVSGMIKCNELGKKISKQLPSDEMYSEKEIVKCILNWKNSFLYKGPCTKLYSKKIIEKFGLQFDSSLVFGEDTCFVLDYLKHCNSCIQIPYAGYHYRQIENQEKKMRYKKDNVLFQWENGEVVYKKRVELFQSRGDVNKYRTELNNFYLEKVRLFMNICCANHCNKKEVLEKIQGISNEKYNELRNVKFSKIGNPLDKLILFFLKYKLYDLLYFVFWLKVKIYNRSI